MNVVEGIGAAHVERRRRALRSYHAEAREELLHQIEVRRPQPSIGNVGCFDPSHMRPPRSAASLHHIPRFAGEPTARAAKDVSLRTVLCVVGVEARRYAQKKFVTESLATRISIGRGSSWKRENTRRNVL